MPVFNSDPGAVSRLQQQQQLQKFREDSSEASRDAAVARARAGVRAEGKKCGPKANKVASEYLVLRGIVVSFPHSGPMRFMAGQRITDPYVLSQLKAAGAELEPIAG